MPRIVLDNVRKDFGKTTVIHEFSADIEDGEFLVLLGPSGCGKSTMLRMIAGLADITSGDIKFDDRVMNDLEPRERNVAFVFQSYALYPHMTVRDNIAFPLIMDRFKPWFHLPIVNSIARRVIRNSPEVRDRVASVASMLELGPLLNRRPRTLSGGQRQRVAVARSLVRDPELYLLDEPLSNLDAKLRSQMRAEIIGLYRKVQKSFVYVTHDQVEAMTMASRIVVMDEGRIRQIGTPEEVYHNPADTFVAKFIGSPPMNLIPTETTEGSVVLPGGQAIQSSRFAAPVMGPAILGVRPENVSIASTESDGIVATVESVENLGSEAILGFSLGQKDDGGSLLGASAHDRFYAKIEGSLGLVEGSRVLLNFDTSGVRWFSAETELLL